MYFLFLDATSSKPSPDHPFLSLEELQSGKLSLRGSLQDSQTKVSSLAQEVQSSLHKSFKGKSSQQEPQESYHLESREGKSVCVCVGQYCYIYQDNSWHGGLIHKLVLEDLIIVKGLTTHKFHWFSSHFFLSRFLLLLLKHLHHFLALALLKQFQRRLRTKLLCFPDILVANFVLNVLPNSRIFFIFHYLCICMKFCL